jgi:TetR/AcrR family fatty acid metabolism transcriptional regulator
LTEVGRLANFQVMESEIISGGQESRSFIETARRAQLVECAIDAIAELGYTNASMAEIAKRAGVSKGVISYHFSGKRELIEQVVNTVVEKASAVMLPRIYAEHSAAGMLRAYIDSNLEFIAANRNHILAMMNIAVGAREDRKPDVDLGLAFEPAVMALATMLRSGQEHGEFREFSTTVMAVTIRNAIDSLAPLLAANPKLDLKLYAKELATTFDIATRKSPA